MVLFVSFLHYLQVTVRKENNMAKKAHAQNGNAGMVVGVGLLAAAAGAYFLYGSKNAIKNRGKIKGWTLRAKGEVLELLEKAQIDSEVKYQEVVDKVMKKYMQVKSIDPTEVEALGKDLKKHWKGIVSDLKGAKKVTKKIVKQVTKKA